MKHIPTGCVAPVVCDVLLNELILVEFVDDSTELAECVNWYAENCELVEEPKITSDQVRKLRSETGCSLMDSKNALVECHGSYKKAKEYLRASGR